MTARTDTGMTLRVHPAPTDEELAAIAVAVSLLRRADRADQEGVAAIPVSKWLRAGRLEAAGVPVNARAPWRPRT